MTGESCGACRFFKDDGWRVQECRRYPTPVKHGPYYGCGEFVQASPPISRVDEYPTVPLCVKKRFGGDPTRTCYCEECVPAEYPTEEME